MMCRGVRFTAWGLRATCRSRCRGNFKTSQRFCHPVFRTITGFTIRATAKQLRWIMAASVSRAGLLCSYATTLLAVSQCAYAAGYSYKLIMCLLL